MRQFNEIKAKYPDAMLLFRVGDFYETFNDDARKASKILGIVLTKRANGSADDALAGFPHHSLDTYLPKLVRAGVRVAVCDQLEDPKATKGIVKRGVTDLVTPGIAMHDQVLERKENNFLGSIHFENKRAGIALLDISTGEFLVAEGTIEYIKKIINNFSPSEVLFDKSKYNLFSESFGSKFYTYGLDEWVFNLDFAKDKIQDQFDLKSLKGFGIEKLYLATTAAGVILHYLGETLNNKTSHIRGIARIEQDEYVWLDNFTIKSLELVSSDHPDAITLLNVIDQTITPMGGRMLRKWLILPLKDIKAIQNRHNIVEGFLNNKKRMLPIQELLSEFGDIERIISKIAVGKVSPKELIVLKDSIVAANKIVEITKTDKVINNLTKDIFSLDQVVRKIEKEIYPDAPAIIGKGRLIADGVDVKLDEFREISNNGKSILLNLQKTESEKTAIPSLKIAFNNVFGYYLEVRNAHKDKVPQEWIRKQTLVNAERYITQELKELETKILSAEDNISILEAKVFKAIVEFICEFLPQLQHNAKKIAELDCLLSFAQIASDFKYSRPIINDSLIIDIKQGRHPVIERNLPVGQEYVANDLYLDSSTQQIIMVTGPNMSGKSALLRQTALITLMAQMGSFVPAKKAVLGYVDRVFTRVGASDNISTGESTFMVEMNETSNILNNLSERSLILLDEIGRGTSTYDGVSIAWAISEYLHEYPLFKAKTLFATHYHELNKMTEQFPRIKNFNVSVKEVANKILFMRKLVEGGSEHSFGIHVAKLAGMPNSVVNRANEVLAVLENSSRGENHSKNQKKEIKTSKKALSKTSDKGVQLSFFQLDDPVLEQIRDEIKNLDINTLTPVEALMKLNEIKKYVGG
ncbi:MAG: DNA mismatch repair protein MutS [Flavobacteriales bacterium]|nr:DNA mismatch repair protein MutS [Flavobacteriales bacterium]